MLSRALSLFRARSEFMITIALCRPPKSIIPPLAEHLQAFPDPTPADSFCRATLLLLTLAVWFQVAGSLRPRPASRARMMTSPRSAT